MNSLTSKRVVGSRVGIVGGSIGGCAAAIALTRLGCEVEVFERSTGALQDRGSGIAIPIPLREDLIDHGYLPADYPHVALAARRWVVADGTPEGKTVWSIPGPAITNNWGVLWRSLRAGVPAYRYHDGASIASIEARDDGVTLEFVDGRVRTFDVVVAADGYRSEVRAALTATPPRYAGYVLWRGNFPEAELVDRVEWNRIQADRTWVSVGFDGGHGVIYPIPDFDSDGAPGSRRVNWGIYTATPAGLHVDEPMSLPPGSITAQLYAQYRRLLERAFPPTLRPIFTSPRAEVSMQPIYDLTVDAYVHGRVALIGDAGSVTRPHTGSGATKAMGDARTIERLGAEHDTWGPLLAAYDADRTAAGNGLVELGRRIGRDQVEHTPPWLEMTAADFEAWTSGTLSGQTSYLYAGRS